MKNLFLLILFFGFFFGAQFVYFENRYDVEEKINFDEISSSIVTVESLDNRGKSFGSGVIISEDGYIITAFHNLSGNLNTVKISEKSYLANLIGFDEYADLAVLKINEETVTLPILKLIDKDMRCINDFKDYTFSLNSNYV